MNQSIKLMVVEDDLDQQQIIKNSCDVFNDKNQINITLDFATSTDEATKKIDGSFDGVILDLKLNDNDQGGNEVAKEIVDSFIRVPIIFVTGHPDHVDKDNVLIIKTRPRASGKYEDDFKIFSDIYNTGLTKIMGGRGTIEQCLEKVFQENLLRQLNSWIGYGKENPERAEKALLRFTLNHLQHLLEDDNEKCFPEEVYISPPVVDGLRTGSIVKSKEKDEYFVVMNPACDLVVRDSGHINTDKFLLVKMNKQDELYSSLNRKNKPLTSEEKETFVSNMLKNKHTLYHHWLPKTSVFEGGFINFRNLTSLSKKELKKNYHEPSIQISSHFVKDILSRFSSYYARQGQPEIEFQNQLSGALNTLLK